MPRLILAALLSLAACSRKSGGTGAEGLTGEGAPGPRGPLGGGPALYDSTGRVGYFISPAEVWVPSVGCALRVEAIGGATDGFRLTSQDVGSRSFGIVFESVDCTGPAYTSAEQAELNCKRFIPYDFSPLGVKLEFPNGRQEQPAYRGERYYRLRPSAVRQRITMNSRLSGGICDFLDSTNIQVFALDEVHLPVLTGQVHLVSE